MLIYIINLLRPSIIIILNDTVWETTATIHSANFTYTQNTSESLVVSLVVHTHKSFKMENIKVRMWHNSSKPSHLLHSLATLPISYQTKLNFPPDKIEFPITQWNYLAFSEIRRVTSQGFLYL